jgi:hypothetical protein
MGGAFIEAGRHGFGSPRLLALFFIIVEGFDQAGEHFRRSLEERLGLRLSDFSNVFAQMIDELAHLSFEFLRVVNRVIPGKGFHTNDAFLEAEVVFIVFRQCFARKAFWGVARQCLAPQPDQFHAPAPAR